MHVSTQPMSGTTGSRHVPSDDWPQSSVAQQRDRLEESSKCAEVHSMAWKVEGCMSVGEVSDAPTMSEESLW